MTNSNLHLMIIEILKELEDRIPQIQCSFVCSSYGLPIASDSDRYDDDRLSAEVSAILSVAEHLIFDIKAGNIDNIVISADNGIMIIKSASSEAVLSVKSDPDVKPGLLIFEVNRTAKKLETLFNKNLEQLNETKVAIAGE
ncbi:MAG: roadblock/LC7 domain-containing protein [Candidatus Helarchaeota archaeon]